MWSWLRHLHWITILIAPRTYVHFKIPLGGSAVVFNVGLGGVGLGLKWPGGREESLGERGLTESVLGGKYSWGYLGESTCGAVHPVHPRAVLKASLTGITMRQQESIHHKNDQRHSRAILRPSRIPPRAAGLNYKQQLEIQMTFSIKSKQNVAHWGPAMKHWCVTNSMRWKRCIIISCMLAFILWWQDWQFMCGLQKVALHPFWKSFGQLFICMFLAKLVASGFWDPEYIKLDATSTSSPSNHVCLWGAINTCIWMMRRGVGMRWRSDRNLCFLKIAWPANLTSQVGTLNGSLCNCKCNLFSIYTVVLHCRKPWHQQIIAMHWLPIVRFTLVMRQMSSFLRNQPICIKRMYCFAHWTHWIMH